MAEDLKLEIVSEAPVGGEPTTRRVRQISAEDCRKAWVQLEGEEMRLQVGTVRDFPDYLLLGAIEMSDVGPAEYGESPISN